MQYLICQSSNVKEEHEMRPQQGMQTHQIKSFHLQPIRHVKTVQQI